MDDLASLSSKGLSEDEDKYRQPNRDQEDEEEDLEEDGMDVDDLDVLGSGQGKIAETSIELGAGAKAGGNNTRDALYVVVHVAAGPINASGAEVAAQEITAGVG